MKKLFYLITCGLLFVACSSDPDFVTDTDNSDVPNTSETPNNPNDQNTPPTSLVSENILVCNQGNAGSDNGQLSYYNAITGTITNSWFRNVNSAKLGDAPNDVIQVNDTLIAIAVSGSNIIQYIHPDGTACGATENIPNNRRLCADKDYLYVTSYAHVCGSQTFTKGYVAKIDLRTKEVVATCEVGWEPDGISLYDGKLYVANTGGYSYSEPHDYESTVQVVDANTMRSIKTIETGCLNLYGNISQAGPYLCINSCGDYYSVPAKTVILDCNTETVTTFDFPCTYSTTDGKLFYSVGSIYSYETGENTYYINTIDPENKTVSAGIYNDAITEKIKELDVPYSLYMSPYTGNIYFTDAKDYISSGYVYGYTKEGKAVFNPQKVLICPGNILALPNYQRQQ